MRNVLFGLIVALVLIASWPAAAGAATMGSDCRYERKEGDLAWLINDYRAAHGLNRLYISGTLSPAGEHWVQLMAKYNWFGHYTPNGTKWSDNQRAHGYTYDAWRGQNLAAGMPEPAQVLQAWIDSPPHNENLLNPNWKVIGIGYTVRPPGETDYGYYWSAEFGGYPDAKASWC